MKQEVQELLDKYFRGNASASEIAEIERLKKSNADFQKALAEQQILVEGIKEFREQALRDSLKKALQKNNIETKEEAKITFFSRRNLSIAAAVLVLIVASFGFYRNATFYERTYANAEPDRTKTEKAGDNSTSFEEENFRKYVRGYELSKNGEFAAAIDSLNSVSEEVELYYFYAQYEIALVYLLEKNEKKAIKQLKFLLDLKEEHVVKEEAEKLLEKLENRGWF